MLDTIFFSLFRYEYSVEIDFQSHIRQLLPDDNIINDDTEVKEDRREKGSGVKKTDVKPTDLTQNGGSDASSIEIDETREDSDDTDDYDSDEEEAAAPNVQINPQAEEQG